MRDDLLKWHVFRRLLFYDFLPGMLIDAAIRLHFGEFLQGGKRLLVRLRWVYGLLFVALHCLFVFESVVLLFGG